MTDYEYIMAQCRKSHYTQWNDKDLRQCQERLPSLSREQLFSLFRSRWLEEKDPLRQTVFKMLFADKIGKREERIKKLSVDELIAEFEEKRSGTISMIRKEMRERFIRNEGDDRHKIQEAFNRSLKSDQKWVLSQLKKEQEDGKRALTSSSFETRRSG